MFSQQKQWFIESLIDSHKGTNKKECNVLYNDTRDFFKNVTQFDFTPSSEKVFYDEYGYGYCGLAEMQIIKNNYPPVFLIDNHDKALMVLYALYQSAPIDIVHIDAHRDDAIFPHLIEGGDITYDAVLRLLQHTKVSDYLDAGQKIGLVRDVYSLTQSFEFETYIVPEKQFVLNLDIDIFGDEGAAVPLETRIKTVLALWNDAYAVIIATSPGFIKQDEACYLIEKLMAKMSK